MFSNNDFDDIQREGLDHCYDWTAERFIFQEYLIEIKQEKQLQNYLIKYL